MLKNALVIMFDSLQRNYIGAYGNTWIKTPNMDRLAREGIIFDNMYIEGLPTIPCRRAMHTGRYTLHEGGWRALKMDDTMISDLCWGRPIDTALILSCPMYRLPKFGYTRGFDKVHFTHGHEGDQYFYDADPLIHYDPRDFHEDHLLVNADAEQGGDVVGPLLHETSCYLKQQQHWKTEEDRYVAKDVRAAIRYLEQVDRNKQFFLWVDSFDPHEPWNPPSTWTKDQKCPYNAEYKGKDQILPILGPADNYSEEELHHVRMLYAELVTLCDKYLGILLDGVRRLGFEENTLFMMVSDHGEPMGNGEHGHGIMRKCRPWPYNELVHAPFIMRGPGLPHGVRCSAYVQSVDIAPTVCDWLGIGVHPDMQGFSLLPLVRGEVKKVRDFSIAGYHRFSWALYNDDWSYIHWVKNEAKGIGEADNFSAEQGAGMLATSEHLVEMGGHTILSMTTDKEHQKEAFKQIKEYSSALEQHQAAATLDGEEQWTCTPGSVAEVPAEDELYNRKTDPYQLHNVIKDHPDVARDLLKQLRNRMAEIQAS